MEAELDFNWSITDVTTTMLLIQFAFSDNSFVSYNRFYLDEVEVLIDSESFVSLDTKLPAVTPEKTTI